MRRTTYQSSEDPVLPAPTWDPRTDGALCSQCALGPSSPLRGGEEVTEDGKTGRKFKQALGIPPWRPVPSLIHSGTRTAAVGEAPGKDETDWLVPFIGAAGQEANDVLGLVGKRRQDISWVNAGSCRPPGNDLERLLYRVQAHNKHARTRAIAEGRDPAPSELLLTPMAACRPRLLKDVAQFDNLILLGKTAAQAFLGTDFNLNLQHGGPETATINGKVWKVLPTYHPAFALRKKRFRRLVRQDIGRAFRWFEGRLDWRPPKVVERPTPTQLAQLIWDPLTGLPTSSWFWFDYETTVEVSPLLARVYCLALGDEQRVILLPILSREDGVTRFYPPYQEQALRDVLVRFFTDSRIVKGGWLSGFFDRLVTEGWLGVTPYPYRDHILDHHAAESEYPHKLGFAALYHLDAPAYKHETESGLAAIGGQVTDQEMWRRCVMDVAATAALGRILPAAAEKVQPPAVIAADCFQQQVCVGLHKNGIAIDPAVVAWKRKEVQGELQKWESRCQEIAGVPAFNPRSHPQVTDLLYGAWRLPFFAFSEKTGDPSADDPTLIQLYTCAEVLADERKRAFLRALRFARKWDKKRQALEWLQPLSAGGAVWPDGRLRSGWSCHVQVTGRLSGSDPVNLTNQEKWAREAYVAGPGRVFVHLDKDQLELRVCAAVAQAPTYLTLFAQKGDPHDHLAQLAWGARYRNAAGTKKSGPKGRMRDIAKRAQFLALYLGQVKRLHQTLQAVEDDRGELVYADIQRDEAHVVYDAWRAMAPEFATNFWNPAIQYWQEHGHIREPVLGRWRECADVSLDRQDAESGPSEIVSFIGQGGGRSLMILDTVDVLGAFPFERWGAGTGLVLDTHDALTLECPEEEAEAVYRRMTECMTRSVPQLPGVTFTAAGGVSRRWSDWLCRGCDGYLDPEDLRVARRFGKPAAVGCPTRGVCSAGNS